MSGSFSLQVAGRTILGEARNQGPLGMRAVAHVLCNRLRAGRWGQTLAEVAEAWEQFSCWNPGDPNRKLMLHMADDDPMLLRAIGYVGEALGGEEDPTLGCMWYKVVGLPWPKDWGKQVEMKVQIGQHGFFDLDEGGK